MAGPSLDVVARLASDAPAWFWHVQVENGRRRPERHRSHLRARHRARALAAVRTNEYYVSQYVDHTPLTHDRSRGVVIASRQNLPAAGASLVRDRIAAPAAWRIATDALQFHGLATRAGKRRAGGSSDRCRPAPAARALDGRAAGRCRAICAPAPACTLDSSDCCVASSASATSTRDLGARGRGAAACRKRQRSSRQRAAPLRGRIGIDCSWQHRCSTRSSSAMPTLQRACSAANGATRNSTATAVLSFFHGARSHVVLRAKELHVMRPHGHLLRTGAHADARRTGADVDRVDERRVPLDAHARACELQSLAVDDAQLPRAVPFARSARVRRDRGALAAARRAVGVRDGARRVSLDLSSCGRADRGAQRGAAAIRTRLRLSIECSIGEPVRFLITHHIALNGDDGSTPGACTLASRRRSTSSSRPRRTASSHSAFPSGSFEIVLPRRRRSSSSRRR